jgi:integrase
MRTYHETSHIVISCPQSPHQTTWSGPTVGLLGGILTYAVEAGIIESNPAHSIRKPKDNVRNRRLTEVEYRTLGEMLRAAVKDEKYATTVDIIRQIALTGCRRSEIIGLMWSEVDTDTSCLRLADSKEGSSIRPIGLPVVEFMEARRKQKAGSYVFPGYGDDNAFGSFPNHWEQLFGKSSLSDVTPARPAALCSLPDYVAYFLSRPSFLRVNLP